MPCKALCFKIWAGSMFQNCLVSPPGATKFIFLTMHHTNFLTMNFMDEKIL
jgi:hypothetical protein